MRAYFMDDDVESDQRLPHDSGRPATDDILNAIGVLHWRIPVDADGKWQQQIDSIASERHYRNRDIVSVTKEGLGAEFETKLKAFYHE